MTYKKISDSNTGFYYEVSDEQIAQHQKYSLEEIFYWIEDMNKLIKELQTQEEWNKTYLLKNKPSTFSHSLLQKIK